ncbi:MAG: hypothetical protein Q8927_07745 [Bacteroidota bacterium]|nr:hypothetical protein [Bacteroidota bacterium]MDP4246447.1 hypothetical protein [Bacteroidota bacterium]MDP4254230.1 hypothetical protein [Bacteroidota bacterium]
MTRLFLPAVLAFAVVFPPSCRNSSSGASGNGASLVPGDDGNGRFAYTLNGTRIVVQRPASSLYINEVSHNAAKGLVKIKVTLFPSAELFDFVVADKGNTNIEHYTPTFEEDKVRAVYLTHLGHNRYGDHVSVQISALDDAHVVGTFSGTFVDEGETVTITDGQFDLPMRAKR